MEIEMILIVLAILSFICAVYNFFTFDFFGTLLFGASCISLVIMDMLMRR